MANKEQYIILGLRNGDEDAYVYLFHEYFAALCAYSRKYVGRKDIAEEIVSETYFKIWKNRKSLQITESVKAYLFRAVCNNSLYYLRKAKKERSLDEFIQDSSVEFIDPSTPPHEIKEQNQMAETLHSQIELAIRQLPTQQQKAFRLKRFEGKKNREVADAMGLSIKTVEMHLSKAMLSLHKNLKDCLPAFIIFMLFRN